MDSYCENKSNTVHRVGGTGGYGQSIGTASQGVNACEITKEVPSKLAQLDNCMTRLEQVSGALEDRLQPITKPGVPEEEILSKTPHIEQTKMGSELETLRARMQGLIERLESNLSRLEI